MKLTQADILACERELGRRSLADFARMAWPTLEPATPLKWGWALDLICEHLEAVSRGEIRRIVMNVPPGSMKSLLTGVIWPAWEWIDRPELRYVGTAHSQELAVRDNMKCRRLIQSAWYQERWPITLTSDQNAKIRFDNEKTGSRHATSFQGITGYRGDRCLVGSTKIATDKGEKTIAEIVLSAKPCNVMAYDEHSERVVQRPVEAVARRVPARIYRVRTAAGRVAECTEDHRWYTQRGYVEARLLSEGDAILCAVPSRVHADSGRGEEKGHGRAHPGLLQCQMLGNSHEHEERKNGAVLQRVRRQDTEGDGQEAVLGSLCGGSQGSLARDYGAPTLELAGSRMRGVRQAGKAEDARPRSALLLNSVQECRTLADNDGGWKSRLARRGGSGALLAGRTGGVQQDQAEDYRAGQRLLCALPFTKRVDRAPPRHGRGEQCAGKLGDAVRELPHGDSCSGEIKSFFDPVVVVEDLCRDEIVYDIQVEGTRNFFANGLLSHNCILDDPHSVDDANSPVKLAADITLFREAMPSRVNNEDSAIVIIMQRLNEADISAVALDLGYDHLCIPMRYEQGRSKWVTGAGDPRVTDGELMFPERFSEAQVCELERTMGSYAVAGQLQQRPSPRGGGIIKTAWFGSYQQPPALEWRAIYVDTAQKTGQENDYSVFQCWGRSVTGQAVLIDLHRGKWEAPDLLNEARAFWLKHKAIQGAPLRAMKVEDKVSGTGLIQTLRREGVPVLPIQRNRDKISRAHDAAPFIESGNVLVPEWADWLAAFMAEVSTFPSGANDDQLDPMFDAIAEVQFTPAQRSETVVHVSPMAYRRSG